MGARSASYVSVQPLRYAKFDFACGCQAGILDDGFAAAQAYNSGSCKMHDLNFALSESISSFLLTLLTDVRAASIRYNGKRRRRYRYVRCNIYVLREKKEKQNTLRYDTRDDVVALHTRANCMFRMKYTHGKDSLCARVYVIITGKLLHFPRRRAIYIGDFDRTLQCVHKVITY